MGHSIWKVVLVMGVMVGQAFALDVPLTVRETTGVDRVGNAVNSGVPLPEGVVKDVSALRVVNDAGQVVLASIEPRARWLNDQSLKWVTVHFVTDLPAHETRAFKLVTSEAELPASEIRIQETDRVITVVTGPAKFVMPTDRFAPFDQVYVRDGQGEFGDGDALLRQPARVVLAGRNGASRVVSRAGEGQYEDEFRTELVRIDEDSFTQTAVVQSAEVEERGPGRAVVAFKGTFSTDETPSLDFTARLYFYSGSPQVEMTFSVRNRQNDDMAHFVGLDRLAIEWPLKTGGQKVVHLPVDGQTIERKLDGDIHLAQTDWNVCQLNDEAMGEKYGGWVRVQSDVGVITTGMRWSWQVHPVGVDVLADGTLALELKDDAGPRVDLYTAGAKTHFLFVHFARGDAPDPQAIAEGIRSPLFAMCDPNWYCQETRVFGDLYANNPALFQPQYRDVIARYQARIDLCLNQIVDQRPRPDWDVNEFGWLNFGSGLHHRTCVRENAHESWWDSNYYDFPHAAIVNFLRTGGLLNLTTAVEAGLHLADLDICHSFPGHPEYIGSPRSGPVVGHFRNYTRGQKFMGHNSFTFYKNESLYELYYLTGERWFHEMGLMSSNFAMTHWGRGALRNVAHGIWGVLSAYHDTHEQKYLDRAKFFVDDWAKPWQDEHNGSFDDQLWMYGLQFEAYDKFYQLTRDIETARYNVMAVDAVMAEEVGDGKWRNGGATSGICLAGYGYAYDYTGDKKYLTYGLNVLEKTTDAEGMRVKTFAQQFRASPYFLKVLTIGYEPEGILNATKGNE